MRRVGFGVPLTVAGSAIKGLAVAGVLTALASAAAAGPTLTAVQQRGFLRCGVNDVPGYASADENGRWRGYQVDFCRATAAAVLGDPEAVAFTLLFGNGRFTALQQDQVDLLNAGVTWTLSRETTLGLSYAATTLYDGQGFIVHASSGIRRLSDATGRAVCVVANTTSDDNVRDYSASNHLNLQVMPQNTLDGVWGAFLSRQCDLATNDQSALYLLRATNAPNPEQYLVLPDIISREPLATMVRADDIQWLNLTRWVVFATILAEEKGVTAANVDAMAEAADPEVRRLLGSNPGMGANLGLSEDWGRRLITAVGNYGEIFDRNLGAGSQFRLARGLNALWRDGGLMYAPPLR